MKLPDSPSTPEPRAAASAPRSACIARLLAILTLALYWPATQCGFVNYDDADYVTANPKVQGGLTYDAVRWAWTTGHAFNWHPLTWMSLMLNAELFGLKPFGFHLVNIALHAAATVLLFYLLLRLTGARWRSAVVAALFAWHPVHVESVAWVSERKDVLSACFGFLALWLYVAYVQRLKPESPGGGRASRFMLHSSCFFFACGLLSKPMLVTWPLVLLLLDYWPLGRFKTVSARSLLVEKLPFFGLSVAASVVTFLVQRHGGAVAADGALPLVDRASNALVSYCRYLGKMFWPADLVVLYRHPGTWPLMTVLLAIIFLCGVSAWCWSNRDKRPYLLMGWLWYLGTLLPVIGLVQVGEQAMADRFLVRSRGGGVAPLRAADAAADQLLAGQRRTLPPRADGDQR